MEEISPILFCRALRKLSRGKFGVSPEKLLSEIRSKERTVRLVSKASAVVFRLVLPPRARPVRFVSAFSGNGSVMALSLRSRKRIRDRLVTRDALTNELWSSQRLVRFGVVKPLKDCTPPTANEFRFVS